MPILKKKLSKNFTKVSTAFLRDKDVKLSDRGLLATLYTLGDKWDFSVTGLSAILPDGKSAITSSLRVIRRNGTWQ